MDLKTDASTDATQGDTDSEMLATMKRWSTPGFETIDVADMTQGNILLEGNDFAFLLS